MARRLTITVLAAFALAAMPATVRADGDPASDVLLGQNVFYPYSPPRAATPAVRKLAAAAGHPLKGSSGDTSSGGGSATTIVLIILVLAAAATGAALLARRRRRAPA